MDRAAEYFVKQAVKIEPGEKLHILQVVNYNSKANDLEGKRIETEMYFALERQFPDFDLFLGKGKKDEQEIYLEGSYEPRGEVTYIKLRVHKNNRIIAQTEVSYDSKKIQTTLVAVLDIESEVLNRQQRRILSEVFRNALDRTNTFNMASSSDVDKMNPDEIQRATGCTRDTCATIIGEQLGVDRVISSSILRMGKDYYYVTAKIMDINDGSILTTSAIKHQGSVFTLDQSMQKLAVQLVSVKDDLQTAEIAPEIERTQSVEQEFSSNLIWHITALSLAALSASQSISEASTYNDLASENESIKEQYASATPVERNNLNATYEDNQEKMDTSLQNIQLYDGLTAAFLLWETYLIWSSLSDSNEITHYHRDYELSPRFRLSKTSQKPIPEIELKIIF